MGKRYSKQAWLSREGPEGDCVIENDTTTSSSCQRTEEYTSENATHTANFTYKGYPVNLEGPFDLDDKLLHKKQFCEDFPIEVVDLPDEPDGKRLEITFEREGLVEASTQTKPPLEASDSGCYQVKLPGSDHQEWSYTLYDFEGQGHVTRQDIKNLVKSMYDVLGKSVSHSKNSDKEPVKTLRVRLSVCKGRGKEDTKITRRECLLSASGTHRHHKRARGRADKTDSIVANPPSTDNIDSLLCHQGVSSNPMWEQAIDNEKPQQRRKACKKCNQTSVEKEQETSPVTDSAKVSHGHFHYPKRMQTGPGECHSTVPMEDEMARVKEWVNQCCESLGNEHKTKVEERGRRKHRSRSRHHSCQHNHCDTNCSAHQCSQYLDLATDHITFPYHVDDKTNVFANTSPLPQRCRQKSEHCHCQHGCSHQGQPVIHRHVHRHHHSHHHYHHYANN